MNFTMLRGFTVLCAMVLAVGCSGRQTGGDGGDASGDRVSSDGTGPDGAMMDVASSDAPDASDSSDLVVPSDSPAEASADDGATDAPDDVALDVTAPVDVSMMDTAADISTDTGTDVALTDVVCTGTHPLLDGGARFCAPTDCYCPPQGTGLGDTCYASAIAAACCGRGLVCPGTDASVTDAAVCVGTHPLLDAGARFCGPGNCYCPPTSSGTGEACYPVGIASGCCPRTVTCY